MNGVITSQMVDAGMRELPTEFIGEMTEDWWRELLVRLFSTMDDAQQKPGPKGQ